MRITDPLHGFCETNLYRLTLGAGHGRINLQDFWRFSLWHSDRLPLRLARCVFA